MGIASKDAARRWCSFANSTMAKADTRRFAYRLPLVPSLLSFNHLRFPPGLAWQMRILMTGINGLKAEVPILKQG